MFTVKRVVVALLILFLAINYKNLFKHPDVEPDMDELITKYGYPMEIHEVVTDDGYIITLHRIPHGKNQGEIKKPVLLMHGMLQSAADFLVQKPGKALALILADEGYDVWLGNARGTTWSRKHVRLDPEKDKEFWNYCFHEIGLYDVSAAVDYILETTKEEKLHYIGYSQGVMAFFVLLSEKPQYTEKFKHMTAMAPAIYINETLSPVMSFLAYSKTFIENLIELFDIQEIFSSNGLISLFLKKICDENSMFVDLCLHTSFLLQGYNYEQLDTTTLSSIFANIPAGISGKQLAHLLQALQSGLFRQFDFGVEINMVKYNQTEPLKYNLSNVKTPVAMYYSENDWIVNMKNVDRIVQDLPNVTKQYLVPFSKFNHGDFVHGKYVVQLLYSAVVEEMNKY